MGAKSFIRKLISNPFIQTLAVYVSGGWILIELFEYFIAHFNVNENIRNIFLIVLLCGLPLALLITWLVSREKSEDDGSQKDKKPSGRIASLFRKPVYTLPGMVIILLLIVFGIRYFNHRAKVSWAEEEALIEIEKLINDDNSILAFDLVKKAKRYISDNPEFQELASLVIAKLTILTEPAGVDVYIREYKNSTGEWEHLGKTPIDSIEMPNLTFYLMRMEKAGYPHVFAAVASNEDTVYRKLFRKGEIPEEMVHVYAFSDDFSEGILAPKHGFFMDKNEVTNEQFKEFVDQGGYSNKDFWKHELLMEGKILSWDEAMAMLTDNTGRPGPSTWEASDYPEGQGNYPVSGISWYEAAAYADFADKSLPTASHWGSGAGLYFSSIWYFFGSQIKQNSNFFGKGPDPVGKNPGINSFGAWDMAGNVREWCWNSTQSGHIIRGGAWGDPTYMFGNLSNLPSFDRSPENGFRCVKYIDREILPEEAFRIYEFTEERDYTKEEPVPEHTFNIFKNQFLYDSIALDAFIEERDENAEDWIIEKVSFNAAYGDERVIAYLYLPKNSKPPFQTLIFFPGSYAVHEKSIVKSGFTPWFSDYLLKNSRAVMFPVFKGTYERNDGLTLEMHTPNESHQFTEWLIKWTKDLSRSIDYLETRPDIDNDRIGYYAHSWGGELGGVCPAVEERLKVSILVTGGFSGKAFPEADAINYVTRIKCPVLMLNGRYDLLFPFESTVKPFYDLLGTTQQDKHLYVSESDHYIPKSDMIRETLNFLDTYFGPVK